MEPCLRLARFPPPAGLVSVDPTGREAEMTEFLPLHVYP